MNVNMRKVGGWIVALGAAFVCGIVNPALVACGDVNEENEEEWGYGEKEMEAAIVGRYAGQVDGESVDIHISRPKAATSAGPNLEALSTRTLQCGNRSFVRPAGACISSSSLDVDADITSESSVIASGKLQGQFTVFSRASVDFGQLSFTSSGLGAHFEQGVTRWYVRDAATGIEKPIELTLVP